MNFRSHMDGMYNIMNQQHQINSINEEEESASDKRSKKKFVMNDAVSSALYKGSKMNSNVMKKSSKWCWQLEERESEGYLIHISNSLKFITTYLD